jgi:hypothetical protein
VHTDKSKVGHLVETERNGKRSRWNLSAQTKDKGCEEAPGNGIEVTRHLDLDGGKHKKGIWNSSNSTHSEKVLIQLISLQLCLCWHLVKLRLFWYVAFFGDAGFFGFGHTLNS